MISCNQHEFVMYVENTWKLHKLKPALGCLCRSVTFNTLSDIVSLSRWVTARLVSSDDKVHSDFKRTHTVMMMTSSHWRQVFQHVLHTKHYSKDFTRMNLSSTKQHVRERSRPPYWGENSVTLKNRSDQTVKKWGNSIWAQVVGRDNWTQGINQLTSREGKSIHREFPENTWDKFKEAEIQ